MVTHACRCRSGALASTSTNFQLDYAMNIQALQEQNPASRAFALSEIKIALKRGRDRCGDESGKNGLFREVPPLYLVNMYRCC